MKIGHALILRNSDITFSVKYSEECAASCEKHGIPYTFFEGVGPEFTTEEQLVDLLVKNEAVPEDFQINIHNIVNGERTTFNPSESRCTVAHALMWNAIAKMNPDYAVAIFEHDVIVKNRIDNFEVPDFCTVAMGYRVENEKDYEPIGDVERLVQIDNFQGAHSYAITPKTAQYLIDFLKLNKQFGTSIDTLLFILNLVKLTLVVADPPPAICVFGERMSVNRFKAPQPTYNQRESITKDFMEGVEKASKLYDRKVQIFVTDPDDLKRIPGI